MHMDELREMNAKLARAHEETQVFVAEVERIKHSMAGMCAQDGRVRPAIYNAELCRVSSLAAAIAEREAEIEGLERQMRQMEVNSSALKVSLSCIYSFSLPIRN